MESVSSRRIAVIGAGVIGLSWAALFASKGHTVKVFNVRKNLEEQLQSQLPGFIAGVPGQKDADIQGAMARVSGVNTLEAAVSDADIIQEAGPENGAFKQELWAQVELLCPPQALLLSSSSGIVASRQSPLMKDPSRLLIGHPFNPPHIMPLVEISAAPETNPNLIRLAMAFYRGLGKIPVQLHKEMSGFVINRLQIALILEAINIVNEGVVSVEELDDIVTGSLGIRWASVGPLKAFHMGGGQGGLTHMLSHIGQGLAAAIGQELPDELVERIGQMAQKAYPVERFAEFQAGRDHAQAVIISDHEAHPVSNG